MPSTLRDLNSSYWKPVREKYNIDTHFGRLLVRRTINSHPTLLSLLAVSFQVLLALTLSVLLSSCHRSVVEDSRTLYVALGASPSTLDPRLATDANGMRMSALMFNSLVKIGLDLNVEGDAANTWTYNRLTYTFRLKPGLKFSNGRPVTPEDIDFSFQQFMTESSPFKSAFDSISSVKTKTMDGVLQVEVNLKEFSAKLLTSDLPVLKILPKAETLAAGQDFGKTLLGTGSFQFVSQNANEIVLAANKNHPYAKPKVDKVVFKIIRDDFTRYQKTLQGGIDLAQTEIPAAKVSEFERRPEQFAVYKYPGLSMSYVLLNMNDPLLKKLKVREALTQSLNRAEIIKFKLEGLGTEATSLLSPASPYFDRTLFNPPFSLVKAQALLRESAALGQELTLKTSNQQSAVENGKVIANQLTAAGLKVKLQSFEWGTFYDDIKKGNFQMATLRWIGSIDPDIYRIAFHSSEKSPGRNRGSYLNPALDRLLDQGLKMSDLKERMENYKKVQRIIMTDLPILPLWYDQQVAIVNKKVKGFVPAMSGDFSPLINMEK